MRSDVSATLGVLFASLLITLSAKLLQRRNSFGARRLFALGQTRDISNPVSGRRGALKHLPREQGTPVSLSAAHRVLLCDELLRQILNILDVSDAEFGDENRDALASLASVCKSISPAALDVLWSRLDKIDPLLSLVRTCEESAQSENFPAASRRFLQYSSRVRVLIVARDDIPAEWVAFLRRITIPQFSHLTGLFWYIESESSCDDIDLFIVPSLKDISFSIQYDVGISMSNILRTVYQTVPDITSLHMHWLEPRPQSYEHCENMLHSIAAFHQLRSLSTNFDISHYPDALQVLSGLYSLENLELESSVGSNAIRSSVFTPLSQGFPALRSLSLNCPYRMAKVFLPALHGCAISKVDIAIQDSLPFWHQQDLVRDLLANFSSSMNSVEIGIPDGIYFSSLEEGLLYPVIITHLLGARLTDVHLMYLEAETLSDALFHSMSVAWPHLRSLRLATCNTVTEPPAKMVTLTGLKWLALHCPDLRDVAVHVNGTGDRWQHEIDLSCPGKATRLQELNLARSLVDSPHSVARYLRWCFPALRQVRFTSKEPFERRSQDIMHACKEVASLLRADSLSNGTI
ncbi:unnamed protein product [Somion occarium]|uniref:F-box domain-containing protein n=1 Tax=Somion occarium TaxID=3059160 RepID=A0ABP1DRB5_9APHY